MGELARRTGLSVKTIRFYSDRGIVVPADRTPAGHRRYGPDVVARLALVRTLRELWLGLDAIRQVVDRELTLGDVGVRRSMAPELPDDPTDEQLEAWVELAELSLDPVFRAGVRRGAQEHAAGLSDSGSGQPHPGVVALARDHARPALASGITPHSPPADHVVAALTADCARTMGRPDDSVLRRWMLRRPTAANDPRRDRYLHLLALVNGWPAPERLTPALDWSVTAIRLRTAR
ncbi:MerR family transcriptional regulator [Streptomyces sp. AS02]|uniref:MerR family transcriptional regulator n=1 Tax=Streptomyces sp. AS02 TaxID=2938946 RepID=UPI0020215D18|nr:MerR family transcriptional regulator [Streptomyces sp. AS02]MCL8015704.1 MerR family transcriptional regulator [Streptomyces sp. AS02]